MNFPSIWSLNLSSKKSEGTWTKIKIFEFCFEICFENFICCSSFCYFGVLVFWCFGFFCFLFFCFFAFFLFCPINSQQIIFNSNPLCQILRTGFLIIHLYVQFHFLSIYIPFNPSYKKNQIFQKISLSFKIYTMILLMLCSHFMNRSTWF